MKAGAPPCLLLALAAAIPTPALGSGPCLSADAEAAPYTLSFPEPGLDDPAAYEGYRTRFFRDAALNTFQVYVKEADARVVNLWADAANESVGFTVRNEAGAPARLDWASDSACVAGSGDERSVEYRLVAEGPELRIGHFVLGSMRVERDFQYPGHHLDPFGEPFVLPELRTLVDNVARLPEGPRRRHLAMLRAGDIDELERRLEPSVVVTGVGGERVARIERPSLDGRNRLVLEIVVPEGDVRMERDGETIRLRAPAGLPIVLAVRVTTDAAPLAPLAREEIFNPAFFAFHDSVRRADGGGTRFRLLERQVRGLELLSSREKLMAGLPNYATYFGRDMLVTALMMQPIWASSMNEHVIASVLRKLAPDGQVSHEEALGGQAIREHAAAYNALVQQALERRAAGDAAAGDSLLERAAQVMADPQRVRENYAMVDDEFQFPVLVARYLGDPELSAERKRAFLTEPGDAAGSTPRLALLLRNLMLVADMTVDYARDPVPGNLIGFTKAADGRYHASSWRDSGVGYGNGRFAMDVNVVWVPQALEAIATIARSLDELGFDRASLARAAPGLAASTLDGYLRAPGSIEAAAGTWRGSARHFMLRLTADEARARIRRKLASLPEHEQRYWEGVLGRTPLPERGVELMALALDSVGEPIGIMSTDMGTRWFLDDLTASLLAEPARVDAAVAELTAPFLPYPVGLLVDGLGPLVANDAYATPAIWAAFERDTYHSPRVVWGREVNLLLLGLMRQIDAAHNDDGSLRDPRLRPYVAALEDGLRRTLDAVEASGLKHNEVWSYRILDGRLQPIRWGNSSDVQLWNLTNLVVEFRRAQSGAP